MKIAVIGAGSKEGEQGGAENFYSGLVNSLRENGAQADLICPISDETNFETIKETYLRFYDLDLSTYNGVITTKAPAYIVRHPNHICYLQHTMRVFYDMFEYEFSTMNKNLLEQREFIQNLDTAALLFPRTKKVYVIGNEVKTRLYKYNGIESEVLYQGLLEERYRCGRFDSYIFMPGRLHRWKRVDLVIRAMKYVKSPVTLVISGAGEDEQRFRLLAEGDTRIRFLGRIGEHDIVDWYANALCIPFVPIHEDFGLITIEAFRSEKPVITCKDAGEPSCIVRDGETGFICDPQPEAIAEKIDYFFSNPKKAHEMGRNGKLSIQNITWENTTWRLLQALSG